VIIFSAAAIVVAIGGVFMTTWVDRLADRTGLGEALAGAALLGATTSLSGIVTSVSAAALDHPDLAVSNAVGGIAVQTAFLAIADMTYRRANLEHAAASSGNLVQSVLLIALLALPLMVSAIPPVTLFGVHPVSVLLLVIYIAGVRLSNNMEQRPMWLARQTTATRKDQPDPESRRGGSTRTLFAKFLGIAVVVGLSGWLIAVFGLEIAARTGLRETVLGALMTAVITSFPELVTTIAAVRRGALQLAVGGIIGGNTFDVLFLSASDVAYRPGSIYHAVDESMLFWLSLSIILTSVLLLGLLVREREGFARIGFESAIILALYIGAVFIVI